MLEKTARPSRSTKALGWLLMTNRASAVQQRERAGQAEEWTDRWLLLCVGEESALLDGEERLLQGTGDSICTQVVGMNSDSRTSSRLDGDCERVVATRVEHVHGPSIWSQVHHLDATRPIVCCGHLTVPRNIERKRAWDINYRSAWMNEFDFQLQTSFGATSIARTRPTPASKTTTSVIIEAHAICHERSRRRLFPNLPLRSDTMLGVR